jgi:hypothetical protein
VKVHPDKNNHPDATKAFQRVAAAWSVLSDEASRKRYDAEMASDTASPDRGSWENSSMSPEDAFATFAFATAACAAGGNISGKFAETLFFAERLVQRRQTGEALNSQDVVSGGFILSSGLEALGATANAAGLKGIGNAADRTAKLVRCASQIAAVGAVASQIPAVQEAIAAGTERATERARQLNTKLEDAKKAATPVAKEKVAQVGAMLKGVTSWVKRARESMASAEASSCNDLGAKDGVGNCPSTVGSGEVPFTIGSQVRLSGLVSSPCLNGATGTFLGLDPESGRCRVQLNSDGKVKCVKFDNIETISNSVGDGLS